MNKRLAVSLGLLWLVFCQPQSTAPVLDETPSTPILTLDKSVAFAEVDSAIAVVTGDAISGSDVFVLTPNQAQGTFEGVLRLPATGSTWSVTVYLFDSVGRKIGQGSGQITAANVSSGKLAMSPIVAGNARPRIDALSVSDLIVSIGDTLTVLAQASDAFGGTVVQRQLCISDTCVPLANNVPFKYRAPATAGPVKCRLCVTDDDDNTVCDSQTVLVRQDRPVVVLPDTVRVTLGDSVRVDAYAADSLGRIDSVLWTIAGTPLTQATAQLRFKAPDSVSVVGPVVLRVVDDDGQSSSDTCHVAVVADPPVPMLVASGSGMVRGVGGSVSTTGSNAGVLGGQIVRFEWRIGDTGGYTTGDSVLVVTAAQAAADSVVVWVRVTDDDGQSAQTRRAYAVVRLWTQVSIPSVGSAGPSVVVCGGDGRVYAVSRSSANALSVVRRDTSGTWTDVSCPREVASPYRGNVDAVVDPLGRLVVVCNDTTSTNVVARFDGSIWTNLGSRPTLPTADYPKIAIDSTGAPIVGFADITVGEMATVMRFDGVDWQPLGPRGFSAVSWVRPAGLTVKPDGTIRFAYSEKANHPLRVATYSTSGSVWTRAASDSINSESIPMVGPSYVARDGVEHILTVSMSMAWIRTNKGTGWEVPICGTRGGIANGTPDRTSAAIDGTGNVFLAYISEVGLIAQMRVLRCTGLEWNEIGPTPVNRYAPGIACTPDGTLWLAAGEEGARTMVVMRY